MDTSYSMVLGDRDRHWLREQIQLAKVCAHEVKQNADIIFVSPQNLWQIPDNSNIVFVLLNDGLTLSQQYNIETAIKKKEIKIGVITIPKNTTISLLKHWFKPITSCREMPQAA